MSRAERQAERGSRLSWHREHELPVGTVLPSVLAAAAGLVAMWPFTSVIEPGSWSFAVLAVIVVTALTGMTCRTLMRGRPAWARDLVTIAVQILVVMGTVILLVAGDTAVFGVVPTEATFYTFQALAAAAWEEIAFGSAPLAASPGLQAVMGLGFGVVAILLDQLVAQRGAILASLRTAVVGSLPMIATHGGVYVVWFVPFVFVALVAAHDRTLPEEPAPQPAREREAVPA